MEDTLLLNVCASINKAPLVPEPTGASDLALHMGQDDYLNYLLMAVLVTNSHSFEMSLTVFVNDIHKLCNSSIFYLVLSLLFIYLGDICIPTQCDIANNITDTGINHFLLVR